MINSIIVIIISSTIFVGSLSVIYDLNSVSTDFLGDEKNVVVIYNPDATTPFTSVIPEILEQSLIDFPGVEFTSAEILQPVVVNDFPVYVRGGRLPALRAFDKNGQLDSPENLTQIISTQAVIGSNIAERLHLQIGDGILLDSIITEKNIKVNVVGILKNSFYTDEILVSLSVARFLSTAQPYQVGHIRVKYNPDIVSKQELFEIALKEYTLKFHFILGNVSKNFKDYRIRIYTNTSANPILSQRIQADSTYYLTTNVYRMDIVSKDGYIIPTNFTNYFGLFYDIGVTVQIHNSQFNKRITILNQGKNIPNLEYNIHSDLQNFESKGTFNENGSTSTLLQYGDYNLTVYFYDTSQVFPLFVNSTKTEIYDISIPYKSLRSSDFVNGSIFPEGSFDIELGPFNYAFEVLIDGNLIFEKDGSIQYYKIHLNTSDGLHTLVVNNVLYGQSSIIWSFTVDSGYELSDSIDLIDYAHYNSSESIQLDIPSVLPESLEVEINSIPWTILESNNTRKILLPHSVGLYTIQVSGTSWIRTKLSTIIHIIRDNSTASIGWLSPSDIALRNHDTMKFWSKEVPNLSDSEWIFKNESNGIYSIEPNFANEVDFLALNKVVFDSGESLSFTPVRSYFDDISFTDEQNNEINASSIYTGDLIRLNFSQMNYRITLVNTSQQIVANRLISVPNTLSIYQFKLMNLHTGFIETLNLQLDDVSNSSSLPELKYQIPSILLNESYAITSVSGDLHLDLDWVNGTNYLRINLSEGETRVLRIPFGQSILNISSAGNSTSYALRRDIPNSGSYQLVGSRIEFPNGFLEGIPSTQMILFHDPMTYYAGGDVFTSLSIIPDIKFTGSLITDKNKLNVSISEFSSAQYNIDYLNGTINTGNFLDYIEIDTLVQNIDVRFTGLDLGGRVFSLMRSIKLNQPRLIHHFTFTNRTDSGSLNGTLIITEVNTQYIHSIQFNSTQSEIDVELLSTSYTYKVVDPYGNLVYFDIIDQSDVSHKVLVGELSVNFTYSIPNLGTSGAFSGTVNYKPHSTTIWTISNIKKGDHLTFAPGVYDFIFQKGDFSYNITQFLNQSVTIDVAFPIVTQNIRIVFYETPRDSTIELTMTHLKIGSSPIPNKITSNPNSWVVPNVPIGDLKLHFKGDLIEYVELFNLNSTRTRLITIYFIDKNAQAGQSFSSSYNKPQLRNGQYGLAQNSEYLNSYLQGSLSIINLILITEVMIVFIISFVNVSIFLSSVTEESIKELRIMRTIGFSHFWTFYSFSKSLVIFGILGAFAGQILSSFFIDLFINSNTLIIFGHSFTPEVNQPVIIIGNIIFTLTVLISSAAYSYRRLVKT